MKKVNKNNNISRRADKIILLLICIMVIMTQTGCKRSGGEDVRTPYETERGEYYSDSSREPSKKEREHVDGITHTVTAGQSIIALKNIYGISIQAIKNHNPEVSENRVLKIGQQVFIPGSPQVLNARRDSYLKGKNAPDKAKTTDEKIVDKLNWPASGTVLSKFSQASKGIYIKIAPGAAIKTVGAGEIVYSGKMKGYGNLIIVDHLNGLFSIYGLNAKNLVNKGDTVKSGARIAIGGDKITEGYSKLYFELRNIDSKTGEPESVDPLKYLKAEKK